MKNTYLTVLALIAASAISLTACSQEDPTQEDHANQQLVEQEDMAENEDNADNGDELSKNEEDEIDNEDPAEESEDDMEEQEEETASIFGNQEDTVYISADRLTVRADSREESESLGSLVKGNEVKVMNEAKIENETWYQVAHHNPTVNEGWISSEFTVSNLNDLHSISSFDNDELNEFFTSPTLFEENTIVAYYGHPNSKVMGIVGRHPVKELIDLLVETADSYDAADDSKGAVPAIYLVYGTVQPGGEIYKMNYDLVMSYIEEAYERGALVYIDHQMGRHHPAYSIREILSFLRYPNVHLALDPEWRTDKPMQEVGHVTGAEINEVQGIMQDYLLSNEIPGTRQYVFHQFVEKMIHTIEDVTTDYEQVLLVHNTSGWGSPEGKKATHDNTAEATNIPYKGFKLWYHFSDQPGVHYDDPLMTPEQVLELEPQPGLVIYQ